MNDGIAKAAADDSLARLDQLAELAESVLAECRRHGASQAEVGLSEDRGLNANVRLGEVETIEYTRDRGLSLTVYFGQRKGAASTADLQRASIQTTIEQACALARRTQIVVSSNWTGNKSRPLATAPRKIVCFCPLVLIERTQRPAGGLRRTSRISSREGAE